VVTLTPVGISSGELFGTTVIVSKLTVSPVGIVSAEDVGNPRVNADREFVGWGIPIGLEPL
jgi:hypothetical protein